MGAFRTTAVYTLPDLKLVFVLLLGSACWAALSRARYAVFPWVAVLACSVAWLRVDQLREGPILFTVSPTHGLTESDLLVPLVICAALAMIGLRKMFGAVRHRAR